jgi:hypothetical protein
MSASKPVQGVASGVHQLDHILGSLLIGDNVIWYDDAGSLAWPFCVAEIIIALMPRHE